MQSYIRGNLYVYTMLLIHDMSQLLSRTEAIEEDTSAWFRTVGLNLQSYDWKGIVLTI